jgi:hypothetical protein
MHFAHSMDASCVVQDAFGGGRFARIDVGGDTDIACLL